MKKLLFALSFLLSSVIAFGAQRSLEQMIAAAKSVIKTTPAVTRSGAAQIKTLKQGSQFTVLGYDSGGFAVIANDDRFNAVLGYSNDGFSADNIAPGMQWWMNAVDEALQSKLESGEPEVTGVELRDESLPEAVPALLMTAWNQGTPYNKMVAAKFDNNTAVPTGCVATAMAQIMRYYKWPEKGVSYKSYRYEGSLGSKQMSANFSNTTYDYENMLYSYVAGGYSDAQADAVAELMLHCGVAVEMDYDLSGSGALSSMAAQALESYFSYSTKFFVRDIYTESEWMDMVYGELAAGRPLLYGGNDPSLGGHAFVIDGYDADGLVHVNWGWSGSGTAYCDIAILNSGNGNYSQMQDMIIARVGTGEFEHTSQFGIRENVTWGDGTSSTGSFTVSVAGTRLSYAVTNLLNCDAYDFTGDISLLAERESDGYITELSSIIDGQTVPSSSGYKQISQNIVSLADLADGTYRVYLASKATTETEWQPVRSNESITNNYILTISNGTAAVTAGEPGWTTGIQGIEAAGADGDGTVRVYTADGVLVYTSPADSFSIDDVPARGLLIVKNEANTTKIMK